jgi:hypothetical protein
MRLHLKILVHSCEMLSLNLEMLKLKLKEIPKMVLHTVSLPEALNVYKES